MADLLQSLAEMADGVMAADGKQRILLWNRAAEALLGVTAQDALGRHCYQVLRCRDERGAPMCEQGCRTMTLATQGVPLPTSNILTQTTRGQPVWLNVSRLMLPPNRHDRASLIYFFRDVSRQIAVEQVLHQLAASLARVCAQGYSSNPGAPDLGMPLTGRERQVLALLAEGLGTSGLAGKLGISLCTAKNHIRHLLSKLGAHTRLEAVSLASRRNLI